MLNLVSPESVGLSTERLNYIPERLNRYVDEEKLPGYMVLVARHGKPAYLYRYGLCDVRANAPVQEDTIYRIYSMTKPITSVALLMLYERGLFQLNDPVSRFIPEFKDLAVYKSGDVNNIETEPTQREVTIRDVMTHTAGFTYGFFGDHPVDQLYNQQRVMDRKGTLRDMVQKLAGIPLVFQPGTHWSYSLATDILGHLVEIVSGQPLDEYFEQHIFAPLGMVDTGFHVPANKVSRFAANYQFDENGYKLIDDPKESTYLPKPTFFSGGGGLVSTIADYQQFCTMLLNKGEHNGARLLGRKTVELMTSNHLPGGGDLTSMGQAVFSETPYDGIGFGLGVSVVLNPPASQILGSAGEYAWGGAASTAFWIDPVEEMNVIFLTQLMPSSTYPIRRELRVLTYQAIVD
ncbi:MAG: serine hydrolase domain-containing protein [Chloroflexota bacterium]